MTRKGFLEEFSLESVTLRKKKGESFDFRALVQPTLIATGDARLPVEEGDVVERKVGSGMLERYEVLDRGFYKGVQHIPDHYQMKVRKLGTAAAAAAAAGTNSRSQEPTTHIYNLTGPNTRINIQSPDSSINVSSITKEEVFAGITSAVNERVDDESQRTEIIQKLNELKSAPNKVTFGERYRAFLASAADHMTILAPFLPPLLELLAKMK